MQLFFIVGVHADGYRPIVYQLYLHIGTKFARTHRTAYSLAHTGTEIIV